MEKEYISLSELLDAVKASVEGILPDRIWVRAEIAGLNRKQNGHCYLDLSESNRGSVVAKVRATIWASRWNYIEQYFRSVTHSTIDVGMEILARARVNFHPVFGLSLDIDEIDPDFTLEEEAGDHRPSHPGRADGHAETPPSAASPIFPGCDFGSGGRRLGRFQQAPYRE